MSDAKVKEYQSGIVEHSPDTAVIDIPGAAEPVTVIDLNKYSPKLLVGGRKPKFRFPGKLMIPLDDGSETFVKIRNFPFSYIKVFHEGVCVFEQPRPTGFDAVLLWGSLVIPVLILKPYIAVIFGMFSMWTVGWWFKKPRPSILVKRWVIGLLLLAEIALGVLLTIVVINMLT